MQLGRAFKGNVGILQSYARVGSHYPIQSEFANQR